MQFLLTYFDVFKLILVNNLINKPLVFCRLVLFLVLPFLKWTPSSAQISFSSFMSSALVTLKLFVYLIGFFSTLINSWLHSRNPKRLTLESSCHCYWKSHFTGAVRRNDLKRYVPLLLIYVTVY